LKEKTKKTERLKRHTKHVGGRLKIDAEKPSTAKCAPSLLAESQETIVCPGCEENHDEEGIQCNICAHLGGMKCVPIMKGTEHLYVIIVKDLPWSLIITDSLFKRWCVCTHTRLLVRTVFPIFMN
jgi:hypothetical protein